MDLLFGTNPRGASASVPQHKQMNEILPTFADIRRFLLSWPFYVIRTRMEINDSGFFTELKALREDGQLIPGPMQLWRGVVPGWIHHLIFHIIQRGIRASLRKALMPTKLLSGLQYDLWEQKVAKLNRLAQQNRLRDSQNESTMEIALSAMKPVIQAATAERETIDVLIDAVSALIAAAISYPFLTIATFSITGAMGTGQMLSMIQMGVQMAFKSKPPKEGGSGRPRGGGGGGGTKMLKTVGGMLYKGMKYRLAEVVLLYGIKAIADWVILRLLHKFLSSLEASFRAEEARVVDDNGEELEEIGSLRSAPAVQSPHPGLNVKRLAVSFGIPFVCALFVEHVFKYIVSHPFEVMSARARVSMPERQGSLWRAFFFRLITRQMKQ